MCIAILNTAKHTIKRTHLKNSWDNNGDGAGILYIKDDKMAVFKEMSNFDTFYNKYLEIKQEHGDKNIVLHFRISTHGKVNEDNCHPFLVDDELGFVHNGMIYDVPTSVDYSDTYMFNEKYLKLMKKGFDRSNEIMDMVANYIGAGNKLIFLNAKDEYTVVNEKAGHWYKGSWFSNTSYQRVNDYVDYGGTIRYKGKHYGKGYSSGYGGALGARDFANDDFEDHRVRTDERVFIDGKEVIDWEAPEFNADGMEVDHHGIIRDLNGRYLGYWSKSLEKITWGKNAMIPVFADDTCDCGLSAEERGKLGANCEWCKNNEEIESSQSAFHSSECQSCFSINATETVLMHGMNYKLCKPCAEYYLSEDGEMGA